MSALNLKRAKELAIMYSADGELSTRNTVVASLLADNGFRDNPLMLGAAYLSNVTDGVDEDEAQSRLTFIRDELPRYTFNLVEGMHSTEKYWVHRVADRADRMSVRAGGIELLLATMTIDVLILTKTDRFRLEHIASMHEAVATHLGVFAPDKYWALYENAFPEGMIVSKTQSAFLIESMV